MEFSLVPGGPLFQLYLRTRLSDRRLQLLRRRLIAFPLLTWVPVFLLSVLDKTALGGVSVPFIRDIVTHVRFLVALPLFLIAERVAHERLQPIIEEFIVRGIVRPADEPKFESAIQSALRWRNSIGVEIVMILFSFTVGHHLWLNATLIQTTTWVGSRTASGLELTPAGLWYAWISMPIFQFIFLRWAYRWAIWVRFLWQVSRLPLRLFPMHADGCGGLGFLSFSVPAFAPIILAESAVLAGLAAGKIYFEGAVLTAFKVDIVGAVFILGGVILGPLCLFSRHLVRCKREGLREYGTLTAQYVKAFDHKWNRAEGVSDKELLGTADIQSLADIGNSFHIVKGMTPVPFGKEALLQVVFIVLLPFFPLVLTIIPLEKLISRVLGIPF